MDTTPPPGLDSTAITVLVCTVLGSVVGLAVAVLTFVQHRIARRKDLEDRHAKEIEAERIQHQRDLKAAAEKGAHDQREIDMQEQIDQAHKKIREVVMPRLEALGQSVNNTEQTLEYLKNSSDEIKAMVREFGGVVGGLGTALAEIRGERKAEAALKAGTTWEAGNHGPRGGHI